MKKKLLVVLLAITMVFAVGAFMTGCSDDVNIDTVVANFQAADGWQVTDSNIAGTRTVTAVHASGSFSLWDYGSGLLASTGYAAAQAAAASWGQGATARRVGNIVMWGTPNGFTVAGV